MNQRLIPATLVLSSAMWGTAINPGDYKIHETTPITAPAMTLSAVSNARWTPRGWSGGASCVDCLFPEHGELYTQGDHEGKASSSGIGYGFGSRGSGHSENPTSTSAMDRRSGYRAGASLAGQDSIVGSSERAGSNLREEPVSNRSMETGLKAVGNSSVSEAADSGRWLWSPQSDYASPGSFHVPEYRVIFNPRSDPKLGDSSGEDFEAISDALAGQSTSADSTVAGGLSNSSSRKSVALQLSPTPEPSYFFAMGIALIAIASAYRRQY